MEMSHQGGAEAESLLRPDQRNNVVMQKGRWEGEGEKAPFLRNEPVKLTPAWEGTNLPDDTLNLKGIAMDLVPPKDKYNLIYLTLLLHGLGTLTAWNMFITAQNYFQKYKLADTDYAKNYFTYVGLASQVPNLFFSWFNLFVKISGNLATRIVWSLCIEVAILVVTIALAMIDTSNSKALFFWLTIISVFCMNGINAVFQNSVYGIAARLPPKYTGAVVLGSNICGTLVVLLSWFTSSMTKSTVEGEVNYNGYRTSAIYYFIGGIFVLLVCFDTYFALPLNRFYRYYETLQQRTFRNNPALAATNEQAGAPPYRTIIKQAAVQIYNIFTIFFVTLAVFPPVLAGVQSPNGLFGDNFTIVTCFFTFNFMAMIGNVTASLWQYPKRDWLVVFTTLRLLFIPFFLVCNYQVRDTPRTLPVLINNDFVYWSGTALLGWSSGHGSSLGMMYVSGTVAPEHASTAGMLGGATLITGIISGVAFAFLGPIIITLDLWKGL